MPRNLRCSEPLPLRPAAAGRALACALALVLGSGALAGVAAAQTVEAVNRTDIPQTEGTLGEYGPPEGYEPGNPHPFLGSENPWNRRMFGQHPADLFYKRRGQRQILAILDGHPEEAVTLVMKRLADDPDDPEYYFMLTVAETQLGRLDSARRAMEKSLALGLPFERFLAGPRDLLAPLTRTPEFRALRDRLGLRLVHGPMLGDIRATQAGVWVRTADESEVMVEAIPLTGSGAPVRTVRFRTHSARDYSGAGTLTGLQPATTYRYRLQIDGHPVEEGKDLAFRTHPVDGTPGVFKIAFGGCAGYTPEHEKIWDVIHSKRPDAMLQLGDNVYLDAPGMPGAFHRYTYYQRQSRPEYRRLIANTSNYAIWDDHDAGMDDVWLGPYRDKPDWKLPNYRFFEQNWNNPPEVNPDWPGCYYRWQIGDVEFFMLDGRSYRTNPYLPEKTMLGPAQKAWLFQVLKASRATFKVIVSPVCWDTEAKVDSHDTWAGFPKERNEIFDFLTRHHIDGVLLISSDRHRSDVWVNKRKGAYDLHEFESGYLTNVHTHPANPEAVFSYNGKNTFGLMKFDTTKADPEIVCQYWTLTGDIVYTQTLKRSMLEDRDAEKK